jgi:hypothetical protein
VKIFSIGFGKIGVGFETQTRLDLALGMGLVRLVLGSLGLVLSSHSRLSFPEVLPDAVAVS